MVYCDRRLLIKNLIVLGKSLMQKCIDPLKANCLRYIALCSAQASMHGLLHGQTWSSYISCEIPYVPGTYHPYAYGCVLFTQQ